ncbi:phage tail assembly protein [Pseudomonas arsenicoxydans]|uniref:phage tail assembly protein n=1 Tax=Pseudomonas arsenicoxydans TaxID=702115 RepID=UPI001F01E9AC|nr:phage tail assembly protein [Pseudomonas arsenicoxydans]
MTAPLKTDVAATPAEKNPNRPVITLDTPIVRGSTEITEVTLRKPVSGELRGVSLTDLLQMDVLALRKVLPRITTPTLTDHDIGLMDPADLVQMATEVAGFLLPKSAKVDASLVA